MRCWQPAEHYGHARAENEHHAGLDKLVLHCKHFPGLLASEGSLEQASTELDRTYEQASCPQETPVYPSSPSGTQYALFVIVRQSQADSAR